MADSIAERSTVFIDFAETANQGIPAKRLIEYKRDHDPLSNPRYWAIVDFNQPSTEKRFYLFDTGAEKFTSYYVAHGHGNGAVIREKNRLYAQVFSNVIGSNCSSLGIYRCLAPYKGGHGNSLQIDGLETTNSNAKVRSVVLHKADYVSETYKQQHGYMGCSEGCFVVENSVVDIIAGELKNGSYIIAWKN